MDQFHASTADAFRPPLLLHDDDRSPTVLTSRRSRRFHDRVARARQRQVATDRLFLAIVPPPEVAAQIADLARHLRISHGLAGRPLEARHFRVALCHVGIGLAPEVVAATMTRVASVPMPAFKVAFDRVTSFRNGALVLCGDDSVIGLEVLQQRLSDALDGRPAPARRFTPHLTLLRDSHLVPEQRIAPISWTVTEVVCGHSRSGRTTLRHLARLPLAQDRTLDRSAGERPVEVRGFG